MAMDISADNISDMVSLLADLFRYGLNNGNELSSIDRELTHLKTYLAIQKYRYNNRFSFTENIDNEILKNKTINIILQPIVENCLIHGFRNTFDIINISITVLKNQDGDIIFTISDDGVGCDSNFMNDYLASPANTTESYGIKNIHNRLNLYFGSNYGITYIKSLVGTKVTIKIPNILEKGEINV